MSIELTQLQSESVATDLESPVAVFDPRSRKVYRLVPQEDFVRIERLLYNDSVWTPEETATLAGIAFSKLDDTDYSHYLSGTP